MTMTPSPKKPAPDSRPLEIGNPASISLRVAAVLDIHQIRATFERLPPRDSKESLAPVFLPVEIDAQILNDSEIGVRLSYGFMALIEPETKEFALESLFEERGEFSDLGKKLLRFFAEAAFVARYQIEPGPTPSKADLLAFAEMNGQLTLTPYWREFLDASLRRAGLPPIMVPVFRAQTGAATPRPTPARSQASAKKPRR
jgi:hypothetical protein